ncbi:MAG: hypothetical protein KUG75_02850, partial [Pseudomonadales bacterium]|nr:hypothetical protein [Pseudomonadales bacterium]
QGLQSGKLDTSALPELELDPGQRIQLELLERWQSEGAALGGYKVGLTSGQARNMFGKGVRPFGFILQERVLVTGADLAYSSVTGLGLENELVFRLGQDLTGGEITRDDAYQAVAGVAPGFEINQIRFRGALSQGDRVADNLSQWGIVRGEFVDKSQDYDKLVVTLARDGSICQEVHADGHIDDHFASIAALANRLHLFGRGLKKDMLVITGSFTRQKVEGPGNWQGDFGPIGQVTLNII